MTVEIDTSATPTTSSSHTSSRRSSPMHIDRDAPAEPRRTASPASTASLNEAASLQDLHVLIGTFNLATRIPNREVGDVPDLLAWVTPPEGSSSDAKAVVPDLVVVGFQELIPQGMGARLPLGGSCHGAADSGVKRDAGRLEFLDPWIDFVVRDLEAAYGGGEDGARTYEPYYVSRMIALGIIVFVRRGDGEKVRIRALWEGDIGTGLLGKYPNKGCVAVGLDIEIVDHHHHHLLPRRRTSLCFANSHLGPHEGHAYYEWRNEEVRHIFDSLLLQPQTEPVHPADEDDKSPNEIVRALDDFNAVFYFGDLNYRLMGAGVKDPAARREYRATVMRHIDAGSVEPLLAMDELCNIREFLHFRALAGWLEPPISFLPSYKYKIEDLELPADHDAGLVLRAEDRFSKTRMPAYCDRIMYRAMDFHREDHGDSMIGRPRAAGWFTNTTSHASGADSKSQVHQDQPPASWSAARKHTESAITPIYYHCASSVVWSDHKPVAALFALKMDAISSRPNPARIMDTNLQHALLEWSRKAQTLRFRETAINNTFIRITVAAAVGLLGVVLVLATPSLRSMARSSDR